jgi:hypothetical protein
MGLKTKTAAKGVGALRSSKTNAAPSKVRKPNFKHNTLALTRLRPIWSDCRRYFQGWEHG